MEDEQISPTGTFQSVGFKAERPATRPNVLQGMAVSLVVHLGIVVSVVIGTITASEALVEEAEIKMAPFTPVELVALGDPTIPDSALPRLPNPAPKTVQEEVVNLREKPDDQALEKPKERPKDAKEVKDKPALRDKLLDEFEHDPNRPVNDDRPKGHAEGVPEGTLTDASAKHLMNTWQAKVQARVLSRWAVPTTIGEEKLKELAGKTRVAIRISPEGHIVSFNLSALSGDAVFDASVERAVKAFMPAFGGGTLPMPEDATIKDLVVRKGITLSGWRGMIR